MSTKLLVVLAMVFCLAGIGISQSLPVSLDAGKVYQVGPGDEITVKVLGEPTFDFVATIDQNGTVEVPFFDKPIAVKCLSERELRTEVAKLLSKYLKSPQLSLRVERKSRAPVTVSGEVRNQGPFVLARRATLIEVLSFSGGVTEDAGGMIQIFRTQPPICSDGGTDADWTKSTNDGLDVPSRMYSLSALRTGNEEANPVIYPGDVIVVQKAQPVYLTGEVVSPQAIQLKEGGVSLSEAIAKIGGVRREAKTKDIKIYRLKPNSKDREIIAANYDAIKKGTQRDLMLEPYDIVEVDKAKKSIVETILEVVTGAGRTAIGGFGNALPTRVLY